jgi:hypothetical protein
MIAAEDQMFTPGKQVMGDKRYDSDQLRAHAASVRGRDGIAV